VVSPKADGVHLAKTPTSNGSDEYVVTFSDVAVPEEDVLVGATTQRANQLALAVIGAYAAGLVAGALRLTADYVANRHQFGKPLSMPLYSPTELLCRYGAVAQMLTRVGVR
jgi:3-oxo-4-pregnene-20-carboxyl-CoA dehydrogenase alpha subunit